MTAVKTLPLALFGVAALFCAAPAQAEIKYLSDPVYEKLAAEDPHPMDDLLQLGAEGDARAQYILGDLYSKGKGGLPRNVGKSRDWFEKSARGGYAQSFIRLAALEKRVNKPEDAYKWYTLAIETLPSSEKKWPQTARDTLVKEAKLTPDQIKAAKKAVQEWKKAAAEANKPAPENKTGDKKPEKKTEAAPAAPEAIEPAAGSSDAAAPAATSAEAAVEMPAPAAAEAAPAQETPAAGTNAPAATTEPANKGEE
jgi:TPR repeat protein